MKENVYLLLTVLAIGWAVWTETERIPPFKKEIHEFQNAKPKPDPAQTDRIEELEEKLQEASRIGLGFKEELDEARSEIQDLKIELADAGTATPAPTYVPTPTYTPRPQPSQPDNSAAIAQLESNLRRGEDMVERIENERPPFKSRHDAPSLGRSGWGAGRNGITTSQADQKRWHENRQARLNAARDYVMAVQDKLAELRAQQ